MSSASEAGARDASSDRISDRISDRTSGEATRCPGRVFLIGYRATGKTSLGEALARRLGYDFQDTDALLEQRLGMSFAEYFETHGQAAFRAQETEVLEGLEGTDAAARERSVVVATGGGIVISGTNVVFMRRTGFVVWLTASIETIKRRLGEDADTSSRRPALQGSSVVDEVERVLAERLPLYRAAAHLSMSTEDGAPESLAKELAKRLAGERG